MFLLLLCAKPIFMLLYSERWLPSVPYFQVLCLSGLAYCLQAANLQSIAAVGKSRAMFIWTIVKRFVGIGMIVIGLFIWGMKGLLFGAVFHSWFSYFVNIYLVSKYIHYKWTDQIISIMPVAAVSLLSAFFAYGAGMLFNLSIYFDGIIKFTIYALIYLGWSIKYKPEAYTYFISILPTDKIKNKIFKSVN